MVSERCNEVRATIHAPMKGMSRPKGSVRMLQGQHAARGEFQESLNLLMSRWKAARVSPLYSASGS